MSQRWEERFQQTKQEMGMFQDAAAINLEKLHYIKDMLHSLIVRMYKEEWSQADFCTKYEQYIDWLMKGIS